MLQFNAKVGDRLKIGEQEFHIAGRLRKIPGEAIAFSLISPRIYIPMAYLNATELLQKGSLVRYRSFFKLPAGIDADTLVRQRAPEFERLRLQPDTVSRRAASIAAATENLARYLTLAVFVAVLLAAACVASVVHVMARVKARSVAVLRCIGAQASDTVWVFAIQVSVVALLSSVAGAGLGLVIQNLLPLALRDFVAVDTIVRLRPPELPPAWHSAPVRHCCPL
jgi:putative ABC transport system permease protein